jgi:iron complex transport system substrate-binding protein
MAATTHVGAQEIRTVDAAGSDVALPRAAQRIAALGTSTAFVIALDGGIDRLVGIGSAAAFDTMLGAMFPKGAALPSIGGMASARPVAEAVAALNPDLVLIWTGTSSASHDPSDLINIGLPVARWGSGSEERMQASIRMVAKLIGKPERGEQIVGWRAGISDRLAELTGTIALQKRPRTLMLWPAASGTFSVYGGGADDPFGNYIYRAGGVNVAEQGPSVQTVTAEQIALWNPEIIFVWGTPTSQYGLDIVLADPLLGQTKAAKSRRVYMLPTGAQTWAVTGVEDALTWQWMAELMYPDLIPSSLRSDLRAAFSMLFNYALSKEQVEQILRFDSNAKAARYDRFSEK